MSKHTWTNLYSLLRFKVSDYNASINLHFAGLTYGQDNEPNCGTFCLAAESTCTCTFSEGFSNQWEVRDANGSLVGQRTVDGNDVDDPTILYGSDSVAANAFEIIVISSTSGTFSSEISFDTVSEYQGYRIECTVDDNSSSRTINVAGIICSVFVEFTLTFGVGTVIERCHLMWAYTRNDILEYCRYNYSYRLVWYMQFIMF